MDKQEIIKEAVNEIEEQRLANFRANVISVVATIQKASENLRCLKKDLASMEYEKLDYSEVGN